MGYDAVVQGVTGHEPKAMHQLSGRVLSNKELIM